MGTLIESICRYSMLSKDGLAALAQSVQGAPPGAIVECGVASGGAAALLWAVTGRDRHLWMFDSWQGLPRPDSALDGGRAMTKHIHRMQAYNGQWCYGSVIDVIRALNAVYAPLELMHIQPGWFRETLPEWAGEIGPIAILHLDGDFYESTATPLKWLWPHVVPGGFVIFDDYDAWPGCKQAADEFCAANGLSIQAGKVVKP